MRSVHLRPWQKSALDRFTEHPGADFLAVATPGAGKTRFALAAALHELGGRSHRRVIVVVPTQHLKAQWTTAAAALGLQLDPGWSARQGRLPADMHGVAVTYQQVAAGPAALRALARDAFVVLDEIHHAGQDRAWGDSLREAFEPAARRLSISGTPFRSDMRAIPFVAYAGDESDPQFEYGYADALADGGVVRPVFFPRVNGQMEWTAPDGTRHGHTFTDRLDRVAAGQRLRTALSLDGEWLPAVLASADTQLTAIRRTQADAAGLVIAMDQDHARGIAGILARRGVSATVITSDDPLASARLTRFAEGTQPWIVAVRMVSEGVDIPRLRVGVFATNTVTELFFRQAVGRLARWRRGLRGQRSFMFIPDDERLRAFAATIAEQRRHSLRRRQDGEEAEREDPPPAPPAGAEEQLSLFAPISAVPIGDPAWDGVPDDEAEPATVDDIEADGQGLTVALAAPPLPGAGSEAVPAASRREHKAALRARNAERARAIVQLSGLGHAHVNRELNALVGLRRIAEATVDQLESRLSHADRWIRRL